MHHPTRTLTLSSLVCLVAAVLFATGCGTLRSQGDTACDDDGDCQTQLGDPPADASWRCIERQCSARAAGPFAVEEVLPAAEVETTEDDTPADDTPADDTADDDTRADGPNPPVGPNPLDVECTQPGDCMVLGPMPVDATWICVDGRCGLRGAGPFHADDGPD